MRDFEDEEPGCMGLSGLNIRKDNNIIRVFSEIIEKEGFRGVYDLWCGMI